MKILSKLSDILKKDYKSSVLACGFLINTYNFVIDGATRGIFAGGYIAQTTIDYITIATTGNATDFGDLTESRSAPAGVSSSTRGVFGGGSTPTYVNTIDYITIATLGNAVDFGDFTQPISYSCPVNSETRGCFAGGHNFGTYSDSYGSGGARKFINYITMATPSNATTFGDLTANRYNIGGGVNTTTRGLIGGGYFGGALNIIEYITIATLGNSIDFGDLTQSRKHLDSVQSDTRGVWGGGRQASGAEVNTLDYVTIATLGNAVDFGDLVYVGAGIAATCSPTRGVFGGGYGGRSSKMDYITIATTGNAAVFGDLSESRYHMGGAQNGL